MAHPVEAGALGFMRAAHGTAGGNAQTTTAAFLQYPPGTKQAFLFPRNFATGVVCQIRPCPYLHILKTTDLLATAGNTTDVSAQAQNATAGTFDFDSIDTIANLDAIYVGADAPFSGVNFDFAANSNDNASVLTVKYWNGTAWTDITVTDGTDTAGDTFKQDGNATWTVPSAWTKESLLDIGDVTAKSIGIPYQSLKLFWTRFEFSAALDASVNVNSMSGISNDPHWEQPENTGLEFKAKIGSGGFSGMESKMNAGTGNLIQNVSTGSNTSRFP